MSGEETVRETLNALAASTYDPGVFDALDALVAERDAWKHKASGEYNQLIQREYDRVVAERDRLREALDGLMKCLHVEQDGDGVLTATFAEWSDAWVAAVVALAGEEG